MARFWKVAPGWLVHVGAWLPMIIILWDYRQGHLTANPIQALTLRTGKTALVLLMLTLVVTPLNTITGRRWLVRLRRTLGLYSFMYAALHFLIFVGLDYGFNLEFINEALFEKRFAYVGLAAGMILLPLAITSTKEWMRRLGKNWKRLHRGIYLAGILAVTHYWWAVKADYRQPAVFGLVLGVLLLLRLPIVRRKISDARLRLIARSRGWSARAPYQIEPGGNANEVKESG